MLGFALWIRGQCSDPSACLGLSLSRAFTSHGYPKEALRKLLGCRLGTRSCR